MPNSVKILNDPEIGEILFRKNDRAKRYIIRVKQKQVSVTIPRYGTFRFAENFFRENRNQVLTQINQQQPSPEPPNYDEMELRRQALSYLPKQLKYLADTHHFHYQSVKIRKSKTRWGSCSSKKIINLSFYLMLLPVHLIDYVLLHELCHTVEMNHSVAFWTLLDRHTGGKAKALRKELRNHHLR
ncbi:MAG: M48 family metallopeptidase [Dysgonamonadaceae bacterium]|jgi:predicted metal-dependent hydrolase|nr:M48 family metallopeptidase [Dysgonamonadaceae bacterium]